MECSRASIKNIKCFWAIWPFLIIGGKSLSPSMSMVVTEIHSFLIIIIIIIKGYCCYNVMT